MNKVSILHISDLHKDENDDYQHLLASLENDIDKCLKTEKIRKPDIIVVSGDIVKGAEGANADSEINRQYDEAKLFLEKLVDIFLNGDKRKIVIVPGNHDINREISKTSMMEVSLLEEDVKYMYKKLRDNSSMVRWDWSNLKFYKITDIDIYNKRFKNFAEFYDNFYENIRKFPEKPEEQSCIYQLDDLKIAFIGFNSCCYLDNLNTSGCIHPTCLTRLNSELKQLYERGYLLIGVWHHHTTGSPNESNYLDKRILSAKNDRKIFLGLHGHQHICGIANEFKSFLNEESLFLISAGTIYGGQKELPYGAKRQYNILEITFDDEINVTVHSREDQDVNIFSIPSWNKGSIGSNRESYIKFNLPKLPDYKINMDILIDKILKEAESDENLYQTCEKLISLGTSHKIVRKFLLDFLSKLQDYDKIYSIFIEPQNVEEAVALLNATIEMNEKTKINSVLRNSFICNSVDLSITYLRNEAQRLINK